MYHHNDTEFFLTLGAEWFGESGSAFKTDKVGFHFIDEALDDSTFARLEIAEEPETAGAFDVDDFACFHLINHRKHRKNIKRDCLIFHQSVQFRGVKPGHKTFQTENFRFQNGFMVVFFGCEFIQQFYQGGVG